MTTTFLDTMSETPPPPEIPVTPHPQEIPPAPQPGPEITPPHPDTTTPESPPGPEIVPDPGAPEVGPLDQ